jgi:hypothetical protein
MNAAYAELPPLQKTIMELVAANNDDNGMHVSMISKVAGANFKGDDVM